MYKVLTPTALQPVPDRLSRKLRPVIGPDVSRHSPIHQQLRQSVQHVLVIHLPLHINGQTLPGVFIQYAQQPKGSAIMGSLMHEVIAPDVILVSRS